MTANSLGGIIRTLRKERGLTQEQLAEGICSPVSVSRIENGRQTPSKAVLDALMDRLGMSSYQLFDVNAGSKEQREFDRRIQNAWLAFDGLDARRGRALLEELQTSIDDGSSATERQRLLEVDGASMLRDGCTPTDAMHALTLLEQGLRLTKPGIDPSDLRDELLSPTEAQILSHMVAALYYAGRDIEAVRLSEEILLSLKRQQAQGHRFLTAWLNVMVNLAIIEEKREHFDESTLYLQQARRRSLDEEELIMMPIILAGLARAKFREGDVAAATHMMRTVADYLDLCDKDDYAQDIRSWAQEHMDVEL